MVVEAVFDPEVAVHREGEFRLGPEVGQKTVDHQDDRDQPEQWCRSEKTPTRFKPAEMTEPGRSDRDQEPETDWEQVRGELWVELQKKFPAILVSLSTIGLLRQRPPKNMLSLKESLYQFEELIKMKSSPKPSKFTSTQECKSSVMSILQKLHQKSLLKVSE